MILIFKEARKLVAGVGKEQGCQVLYPLKYAFFLICFYQTQIILGDPKVTGNRSQGRCFGPQYTENQGFCSGHCGWVCGGGRGHEGEVLTGRGGMKWGKGRGA